MLKKIEKPDVSTVEISKITELIQSEKILKFVQKSFAPYANWKTVKYWKTEPEATPLELWAAIKFIRANLSDKRTSVIQNESGQHFTWMLRLPGLEELLHDADMNLGGNSWVLGNQGNENLQQRMLSRGVMEEAIASSQLEGAHTSRKAAKKMLLEGRAPKNVGERMIMNNHRAMLYVENEMRNEKLTEESLLGLHKILTEDTLEPGGVARYRTDGDDIVVSDPNPGGGISHVPPKESFLQTEVPKLIAYANDEVTDGAFLHPLVKAILLHFWIGYLHPFVDGNGRVARAIFYWYLIKKHYWAFSYLPISKAIKASPSQYGDAYIHTEQDDSDLTYFIDYNMGKLVQAMKEFEAYRVRKSRESGKMAILARGKYQLNERQMQLLRYYYKNGDATTSVKTHSNVYATSRITAKRDLLDLQKKGFVVSKKVGVSVLYYGTQKVAALFG